MKILLPMMLALSVLGDICGEAFITKEWHGDDRLGDQIILYMTSQAIAKQFGFTYLHRPFDYSDQFLLERDAWCPENPESYFDEVVEVSDVTQFGKIKRSITRKSDKQVLYVVKWSMLIALLSRQNKAFFRSMRKKMAPNFELQHARLPHNAVTVALHVRTGGGYDSEEVMATFPNKFPDPVSALPYLNTVVNQAGSKKVYVYVFTDDRDPLSIVQRIEPLLKRPNVVFDCRREGNAHDKNVLEDFFFMMKFDYLIRPSLSMFPRAVGLLGDFKRVFVYPPDRRPVRKATSPSGKANKSAGKARQGARESAAPSSSMRPQENERSASISKRVRPKVRR